MTETTVAAQVHLLHPRADAMSLGEVQSGILALRFTPDAQVYLLLGTYGGDREADAKAMDRLGQLATEAAARLRKPQDGA